LVATSILEPVIEGLDLVDSRLNEFANSADLPYLDELLNHAFASSGKLARPALTLLTSGFNPHGKANVITMATAVEMLHVATLIHDDTVDGANTRRGKITVSAKYGQNTAVLLGDFIFAASATYVCNTENITVIKRFSQTIMDLSRGQLQETANSYKPINSINEYLQRIYLKTGSLFSTAGESGAILSGASDSVIQSLKEYSENIGLAFQITDDILDLTANEYDIGKPVGADLQNGIITLPTIYAMEKKQCKTNIALFFTNPDDHNILEKIIEDIQKSDSLNRAYKYAAKLAENAKNRLVGLENNKHKESLELLADFIIARDI